MQLREIREQNCTEEKNRAVVELYKLFDTLTCLANVKLRHLRSWPGHVI